MRVFTVVLCRWNYQMSDAVFPLKPEEEIAMGKLQLITRQNGSIIYSTYLPKEQVEEANMEKGDVLEVKTIKTRVTKEKVLILRKLKKGGG